MMKIVWLDERRTKTLINEERFFSGKLNFMIRIINAYNFGY